MIVSVLSLRLRVLGRWVVQWMPLSIIVVLEYVGGLLIEHHWVQLVAVPLFLWMLEGVAFLGIWFQITLAFAVQAPGPSWMHRLAFRLSGLTVPVAAAVWVMACTTAPIH